MSQMRRLTAEERVELQQRGCRAESWDGVLVSEDFAVEQVSNVRFSGSVSIGSRSIIRDVSIRNYAIATDCHIEAVMCMECRHASSFGEGVEVAAVNENGGRSVTLYREITSQTAYLMAMMRNRKEATDRLIALARERAESHRSDVGEVGAGTRIFGVRFIREVRIEEGATIEGVSLLENGTVGKGCFVGVDVRAHDFVFSDEATIEGGVSIERCYVGERCKLANGFTAIDTLFFANCHCENGESAAVFAGPFTVSHHKSSLLIAGIFSFFNAGSGTNQSNHLFKSGAIHQAVHQRGTKFGSSAYVMAPSIEGAFTVVLGRHTRHHDTQDMPYSYLIEEEGRSSLMPGMSLTSYGTVRDVEKWRQRDKRTLKRDNINFEEFNPFLTGRMLRGVDALTRMQERDPEAKSYTYNRTTIRATMLVRGIKLYNSAIAASLGMMLREGNYLAERRTDGEWIDVAGQYVPFELVEELLQRIARGECDLEQAARFFDDVAEQYSDMAAVYAYGILAHLIGHTPTQEDVEQAIAASDNILQRMRATTDADRNRDMGTDMMVGYGYDFRDEAEHEADFVNTHS